MQLRLLSFRPSQWMATRGARKVVLVEDNACWYEGLSTPFPNDDNLGTFYLDFPQRPRSTSHTGTRPRRDVRRSLVGIEMLEARVAKAFRGCNNSSRSWRGNFTSKREIQSYVHQPSAHSFGQGCCVDAARELR